MEKYQKKQSEYEALNSKKDGSTTDKLLLETTASSMAELLNKIESDRTQWLTNHETAKTIKTRLEEIEEEITDEKAKLVATAGTN